MNDEGTPDADHGEECFDQEADPQQDAGADIDLSGFMKSARQTAAWLNSIDKMLEPARHQIRALESTRRAIDSVMGPSNAVFQAALDAQRQYRAIATPIQASQIDLSDIYDWHRHIHYVIRSVSLPRTLLDQLAAAAAFFLPAKPQRVRHRGPLHDPEPGRGRRAVPRVGATKAPSPQRNQEFKTR